MPAEPEPPIAAVTTGPLPGSRKVYVPGRVHPDLRVPMREIALSPSLERRGGESRVTEENPPLLVYDTSGPYTDPSAAIARRVSTGPRTLVSVRIRSESMRVQV